MNDERINKILTELESGYDQMSDKFSGTRKFFWRDLEFISEHLDEGDRVLDYGCGNGRLVEILGDKKIEYCGADISQKLLDKAQEKYPGHRFIKISSQDSLPFPDNYFNKVVSIAVFHHFPASHACKMAKELFRITKPKGVIIVTVWNLWQKQFRKYLFSGPVILGKVFQRGAYEGLGMKDIYIPFKNNDQKELFNRYHRAMTKNELKKIFLNAGFKCEKSAIIKGKNIIFIGKKQ